jgi:putative Mg2+ transporter-C (MgtC) family protein
MIGPHDLLSILLAVILGGAIGAEREISGKAAGLRTNVLICLGAAVFTIISKDMAAGTAEGSVTRIAAQIVSGVGFLGAGAIIQDRGGVHGLTTAATIWLVASIGTACGARFYQLAVVTALIAVAVLVGLGKLAKPLERYGTKHKLRNPPRQPD